MYIALGIVSILFLLLYEKTDTREKKEWVVAGMALCLAAICMPSGIFQNFYGKESLLWLFPIFIWAGYTCVCLWGKIRQNFSKTKQRQFIVALGIVFVLCGNISMSGISFSNDFKWRTHKEIVEVLQILESEVENGKYVYVAGPDAVQRYVRSYSGDLYPVYGRDLWEAELVPYFYDGYSPIQYTLREYLNKPLYDIVDGEEKNQGQYQKEMLEAACQAGATYVILQKTNLIPPLILTEEAEKEVMQIDGDEKSLYCIAKTESYMIYTLH